jgi:hypothetical protein
MARRGGFVFVFSQSDEPGALDALGASTWRKETVEKNEREEGVSAWYPDRNG